MVHWERAVLLPDDDRRLILPLDKWLIKMIGGPMRVEFEITEATSLDSKLQSESRSFRVVESQFFIPRWGIVSLIVAVLLFVLIR